MNSPSKEQSMSQKIFDQGLSVETVSVYLLCCGIADAGSAITLKRLLEIWNSTPDALNQGIEELENKNIIRRIVSGSIEEPVFKLTDVAQWTP